MQMKTSEKLKQILDFFTECESSYNYCQSEVEKENKRLYDFGHQIEFETDSKKRSKLATQFHRTRQHRRSCKNDMEVLEPIYKVMQTKEFQKAKNLLTVALGDCRKVERYHENRSYHNKVKDGDM